MKEGVRGNDIHRFRFWNPVSAAQFVIEANSHPQVKVLGVPTSAQARVMDEL